MAGGGFFLLSGYAGTGKTFLMNRVLKYIESEPMGNAALTAPTHKALKVLRDLSEGTDLYTTHAFLGMKQDIDRNGNIVFVRDKYAPCPAEDYQIAIVDEASMVADEIFDELEDLSHNMKIIFVGDSLQIPPVNCDNSLPFERSVQQDLNFKTANLDQIVRQAADNPIIATSMAVREKIGARNPGLSYQSNTNGLLGVSYAQYDPSNGLSEAILNKFASDHFEVNPDYVKIIAWTNAEVNRYNKIVRAKLFGENLPKVIPGDKLIANAPIREGKQTLVQNNEDMEVLSVQVATDAAGPGLNLKVYKAKVSVYGLNPRECIIQLLHEESEKEFKQLLDMLKSKALLEKKGSYAAKSAWMDFYKFKERYADVKYAYAITAHKSQGSTYDHAIVMMYDLMRNRKIIERNRILYTSVTRPKYTLKIIH